MQRRRKEKKSQCRTRIHGESKRVEDAKGGKKVNGKMTTGWW
jgi:hypothetical protein